MVVDNISYSSLPKLSQFRSNGEMSYRRKSYCGFYPHHMIRKAQDTLAYSIRNSNNRFLRQVRLKCGLEPYSHRGGFHSQYTPRPHNDLWHEDALKYRYTFPWSDRSYEGHNNNDSYISQENDEPEIPQSSEILYDNIWCEDALGSNDYGYLDFTESTPSKNSTSSKNNYRATNFSKGDGKLRITVNSDSSEKQRPDVQKRTEKQQPDVQKRTEKQQPDVQKRTTTVKSSHDCITISDSEEHVDLTNDSDEPKVVDNAIEKKQKNKSSKRKYSDNESTERFPNENKSSISGPPVSKKQRIQFSQGLVCDYCGYVVTYNLVHHNQEAEDIMKKHFFANKHNAASLAKIQILGDNTGKAITILKEGILVTSTDKHVALVNKVVPMCPKKGCTKVLATIWECAKHYEMYHDEKIASRYGLADVVSIKTILIPGTNTCGTCNCSFHYASELHKHWRHTNHLKGHLPSSKEEVGLYFCPYCNKPDYNFHTCREHIIMKHKPKGNASMHVVFIKSTTNPLELLPIEPRPAEVQGKSEMNVLLNMDKNAKLYGGTKTNKKRRQAEKQKCKQRYQMVGEGTSDKTYSAFKTRCNSE